MLQHALSEDTQTQGLLVQANASEFMETLKQPVQTASIYSETL